MNMAFIFSSHLNFHVLLSACKKVPADVVLYFTTREKVSLYYFSIQVHIDNGLALSRNNNAHV